MTSSISKTINKLSSDRKRMMMQPAKCRRSSPKSCLLLKTLLFLLCIYIKRATGAPLGGDHLATQNHYNQRQDQMQTNTITPAPSTTITVIPLERLSNEVSSGYKAPAKSTVKTSHRAKTTTTTTTTRPEAYTDSRQRTPLGANIDEDDFSGDSSFVHEGEDRIVIECPLDRLISLRGDLEPGANSESYLTDAINLMRTSVIWYKDGEPFHRENGNFVDLSDRSKLALFKIGPSDAGLYTCYPNYTSLPPYMPYWLDLQKSHTKKFVIEEDKFARQDIKPLITHQPGDLVVNQGANVTFTCNRVETMRAQFRTWFKFNIFAADKKRESANSSTKRLEKFFSAYNEAKAYESHTFLGDYVIPKSDQDKLKLINVSQKDVGYYGCFVGNNLGFDMRLGTLDLFELHTPPAANTIDKAAIESLRGLFDEFMALHSAQNSKELNALATQSETAGGGGGSPFSAIGITFICLTSIIVFGLLVAASYLGISCFSFNHKKKLLNSNLCITAPMIGDKEAKMRQHLPNGDCPDIYNIGKDANGFISGHLRQEGGQLMSQSICNIDKENNPSISSNSNSDEASSMGKSMLSHGDATSKSCYLPSSSGTDSTAVMYDHPPSTGTSGRIRTPTRYIPNPDYVFPRQVNQCQLSKWAFPRRNLEQLDKIGEGHFGEVWRYIAHQKDGTKDLVAVKQLRNRLGCDKAAVRQALLDEIEIMKMVDNHPNVIKLLHHCVDDHEPVLLIMEYAELGKLQTYLRGCRASRSFPYNIFDGGNTNYPNITSKELIKFSYHIADGMAYIASKGILHRDLASRNILVSRDKVCKVADFGFARRVNDECAYQRSSTNPIPVKWMAPEATTENTYTTKSDVFSLGIVMWEIVTLGATPYEKMNSNEAVEFVKAGGRLERPKHCKDELFDIMSACWHQDPAERPSFKEVSKQLEKLCLSANDYIELDQYPEHAYYNIANDFDGLALKQNE